MANSAFKAYVLLRQRLLTRLSSAVALMPRRGHASVTGEGTRLDDSRIFRRDGSAEPGQLLHFPQAGSLHGSADSGIVNGHADPDESSGPPSTADLFGVLWRALADILGTAAAATLLRRAAQRAQPHWPELTALAITRVRLDYTYTLPASWKNPVSGPPAALSALTRELWPLLIDLTGPVVVQRLTQLPELQHWGILPSEEAPA